MLPGIQPRPARDELATLPHEMSWQLCRTKRSKETKGAQDEPACGSHQRFWRNQQSKSRELAGERYDEPYKARVSLCIQTYTAAPRAQYRNGGRIPRQLHTGVR